MRTTRLALPWSAGALLVGALASGCATSSQSAEDGLRVDPGVAHFSGAEQRERADSERAQMVADEVGPRVNITADFDYAGGSRQVQASFHMYDDAYVIVGHLDAAGRLKIVFPAEPGDDGFVRGDKIYHVPTFFAGFADEYAWRYNDYRYRYHSTASRSDSYDAGLGYVFVIASWRPMRLDRVADGNRWQTYDVTDVSYMQDPREAIEELGSVIAGDNREAYTIQYARYTTTNYGTYSYSDFDRVNSGCYGYSSFGPQLNALFFSPFGFLPSYGLGYGSMGCNSAYSGLAYGVPYGLAYPLYAGPPGFRPPFTPPTGVPMFHRPQLSGILALHKPEATGLTPTAPMGPATVNGVSVYRRPGLVAEDAAPRGQGRDANAQMRGVADHRPTIQDMVGRRGIENGANGFGARGAGMRDNPGSVSREPTWSNRGGARSAPRAEGAGNVHRNQGSRGMEGARSAPARERPSYSAPRSQPAARSEPSHAAPARAEAPRPASSSGSKKP
jgi:hypothetical protein